MTRLAARQRLQRQGGGVQALRERETLAFRRALYRSAVRVRGVACGNQGQQQRDITAESFRRNPAQLHRLRPWLRRELTVLYGAHATLVDIVQRIITARLARHGLEDTPTIEEELRPFLLARTEHFLHELVSFARSPLGLESYDLHAVYEPPAAAAVQLDASGGSDSSSVIAISEDEHGGAQDDVMQTGSCLSLAAWDDETPGPSYTSAGVEAPCPPAGIEPPAAAEDECLIVGYKKPIAERTPELVQLSSDSEEDKTETLPPLAFLPTIPPCSSRACSSSCRAEPDDGGGEERRLSVSSGGGSAAAPPAESEMASRQDRKSGEARRKRRRERKSGTLSNPNRSIFPAMTHPGRRGRRRSPCLSGGDSSPDSSWELPPSSSPSPSSPPRSSSSSSSSSSPPAPSPLPSNHHQREKPGGKRKYKSRHLDAAADPTWRPSRKSGSRKRRSRAERSPSVEIIYEGTVAGNAAPPPAAKRRRRPRRHARLSSSPVIITLDSDSSHDNDGNNDDPSGGGSASSSPLSSQQTVDFSDLPPLPPLHSAAVDADLARLPVRILDRGSDGADGSDVDVENVDSGSPPGSPAEDNDGDEEAARGETKAADRRDGAPAARNDPGVPNSDSRLLATILDDLAGISAAKPDAAFNFEPQLYNPPGEQRADAIAERHRGADSPPRRASARPPPLEHPKESGFGEEAKDAPPRPYDRNTLPPLKHKHAIGLNPSPFAPHAHVGVNSHADLNSNPRKLRATFAAAPAGGGLSPGNADLYSAGVRGESQDIPPISTLKRHFTSALALRGEPASAGGDPADAAHPHARFSPVSSRPNAPSRVRTPSPGGRSPSHNPPANSRASSASESSSSSDFFSHLEFDSLKREKHFGRDEASSPAGFYSARICFPEDGRASTSAVRSNDALNARQAPHVDVYTSISVSSERPSANATVLSGVYLNDASSIDPSPPSDARTPAPGGASLPFNTTPRSPGAEGLARDTASPPPSANHGAAGVPSSVVYPFGGRLIHAASATLAWRENGRRRSESPGEPDSRLPRHADSRLQPENHFDAGSGSPSAGSRHALPAHSPPNTSRRELAAGSHESQRDSSSAGSDSEAPGGGERSVKNVWDTHTHAAT